MSLLVSIIIPAHNAERWLVATLESALAQTWPRCEVILVDDGSTDRSLAIARSYEARNVTVIAQPNRGAAAARNAGLRAAGGEYIQFLDADDLLAPGKIEHQMRMLAESGPEHLAAGSWGRFTDGPASATFVPEDNWRTLPAIDWLRLNFAGRGMMPPAAWLAARTVLDRAGPWDETLTLNDDGEYFCRVALASRGILFCPEALSFYRSGITGSLSQRRTHAAWDSAWRSQQLCAAHLLAAEDSPSTRQACADLFRRLSYAAYADAADIAEQAEQAAHSYGGSTIPYAAGRWAPLIAKLVGWRSAAKLSAWLHRAKS